MADLPAMHPMPAIVGLMVAALLPRFEGDDNPERESLRIIGSALAADPPNIAQAQAEAAAGVEHVRQPGRSHGPEALLLFAVARLLCGTEQAAS